MAMNPKALDAGLQAMVERARADLAERQAPETDADTIELVRAERVTWRSSALGCPLPDRGYPMVLTPGVRIVLRSRGAVFEYHGSRRGTPFLCEPPATIEAPAPVSSVLNPDPT